MDLRLFSIENAPRTLPVWELILDDLGRPPAERIARTLDVGVSTVYRWSQTGQAPRMAVLSLFWLTRWGRSEIDCKATNDAMAAVGLVRTLHEERSGLRATVEQLRQERDRLAGMVARFTALAHENADRGNAAIAHHSRTGMALGGSWGGGWSLAWGQAAGGSPPPHVRVVGTEELPQQEQQPERPKRDGRQGSPEAPQPAGHSTRCQAGPRSHPPQPSSPQEASQSSPCDPQWYQSDAIMASDGEAPLSGLLELRQAQAERPGLAGAPRPAAPPASSPAVPTPAALSGGRAGDARAAHQPEHASQVNEPAEAQAPAAEGQLSGAPAPAPARSAFAALVAALS